MAYEGEPELQAYINRITYLQSVQSANVTPQFAWKQIELKFKAQNIQLKPNCKLTIEK